MKGPGRTARTWPSRTVSSQAAAPISSSTSASSSRPQRCKPGVAARRAGNPLHGNIGGDPPAFCGHAIPAPGASPPLGTATPGPARRTGYVPGSRSIPTRARHLARLQGERRPRPGEPRPAEGARHRQGRLPRTAAPPPSPTCRNSSGCGRSAATSRTTRWPISTSTSKPMRRRCWRPAARCTGARPPTTPAPRCWRSAASAGARTVTKGKSMISEELGINDHLEATWHPAGRDRSRRIHPAAPRRAAEPHHRPRLPPEPRGLGSAISAACTPTCRPTASSTNAATSWPRPAPGCAQQFLAADVGITGANFLIAETGSSVIVTNEGNGDLTQTLPRVHIALASIEKVVPTLEDATSLLRLLARSATGQDFSVYTTFSHRRPARGRSRRAGGIPCRAGR